MLVIDGWSSQKLHVFRKRQLILPVRACLPSVEISILCELKHPVRFIPLLLYVQAVSRLKYPHLILFVQQSTCVPFFRKHSLSIQKLFHPMPFLHTFHILLLLLLPATKADQTTEGLTVRLFYDYDCKNNSGILNPTAGGAKCHVLESPTPNSFSISEQTGQCSG